jgi:hypothetical protein
MIMLQLRSYRTHSMGSFPSHPAALRPAHGTGGWDEKSMDSGGSFSRNTLSDPLFLARRMGNPKLVHRSERNQIFQEV